jgi:hypothetical protein
VHRFWPLPPVLHPGFLRAHGLRLPDSNVLFGESGEKWVKNSRRVARRDAQIEYAFPAENKSTYKLSKTYETHTTSTIHTPPSGQPGRVDAPAASRNRNPARSPNAVPMPKRRTNIGPYLGGGNRRDSRSKPRLRKRPNNDLRWSSPQITRILVSASRAATVALNISCTYCRVSIGLQLAGRMLTWRQNR